jgi:HAE1 family hydrophobic/amphiphilic exporter-1
VFILQKFTVTSIAFILACVPLCAASGSGATARQIIGAAVIGGMLVETFLGRYLVPAIFYVVERLSGEKASAANFTPVPAHGEQA